MRFAAQLGVAASFVALLVGGLWLARRQHAEPSLPPTARAPLASPTAPNTTTGHPNTARSLASLEARDLLPASAWLVADFAGDLTGSEPFLPAAGEAPLGPDCDRIPPPERVGVAAVAKVERSRQPLGGKTSRPGLGELDLVLAAPRVSPAFFACAERKIGQKGGRRVATARGFTVLQSPAGVIVYSPEGHLWFSTSEEHLTLGLALLRGQTDDRASLGAHAELLAGFATSTPESKPRLALTLAPPPGWSSGDEDSPFGAVERAALLARVDGSALGSLHCREPGCERVLEASRSLVLELGRMLPASVRTRAASALGFELVPAAPGALGRVVVTWSSADVRLEDALEPLVRQIAGRGDAPSEEPPLPTRPAPLPTRPAPEPRSP